MHDLEEKQLIKIVEDNTIDSPSLPGEPLMLETFKKWIAAAEEAPAISLKEAQAKWQSKRKQLQKHIR